MKKNLLKPLRQQCAEAALVMPKDSKDLKGIRTFFENVRTQAHSVATTYSGPLNQLFTDLAAKFEAVLGVLPKDTDGNWSLTDNLDCFFSCLTSANAVAQQLSLELSKARQTASAATPEMVTAEIGKLVAAGEYVKKSDVLSQIASAVEARIAAGELVAKDRLTQLCSASKETGIEEGKRLAKAEVDAETNRLKLISQRKSELQTASLALPETQFEAILGEPAEKFEAAKKAYGERETLLKKNGIQLNSELLPGLWLPSDQWGTFERLVNSIPALKMSPNPLLGNKDESQTNEKPIIT